MLDLLVLLKVFNIDSSYSEDRLNDKKTVNQRTLFASD